MAGCSFRNPAHGRPSRSDPSAGPAPESFEFYGLTADATAGPDGADGADAAGGVSRLAAIDMNRMKMTAPIAAPNVRFTTLSLSK